MSASGLPSNKSRRWHCFDAFTLDLEGGFLKHGEEEVLLRPKAFEVLRYLVERQGRLVTKSELIAAVWPDAVITDNSLAQCLVDIRRALGDDAQRIVRTVSRRGYVFAAPVTEPAEESLPVQNSNHSQLPHNRRNRKLFVGAVALAVILTAVAILLATFIGRRASRLTYTQLTNFTDSAVQPAISADGRMITFIRGEDTFVSPGQIYVKMLPDGEPVQITNDRSGKMSPVFLPDGGHIGFTAVSGGWVWDTWIVPVLGGQPNLMLANASGTTWIPPGPGPAQILFSELTGEGSHMVLVTAAENRSGSRRVYVPPSIGMAHRSYLSPDRRWVLLAEMAVSGWLPCRLVPYDGSSSGRPVGPQESQCTDAAWSPDNKWMYLSANTGTGFHIWRQRFPGGAPEQVTSGATEEQGVAFAPDGRSFLTSIGSSQSALWVHDSSGERQITSDGYAFLPSFSPDGSKLYFLLRAGGKNFVSGGLWVMDLKSGHRQKLLPEFVMQHYSVSGDGRKVVFIRADHNRSPVWIAMLDGSSPPHALASIDGVSAFFAGGDSVVFHSTGENSSDLVYRVHQDGSGLERLLSSPVIALYGISPDRKWVAAWIAGSSPETRNSVVAIPIEGGTPVMICPGCGTVGAQRRGHTPPSVSWSPDQKFFYLVFKETPLNLYAIPLRDGQALPALPRSGIRSVADIEALPGVRLVSESQAFAGPNPGLFAYTKVSTQRNIYRVGLP